MNQKPYLVGIVGGSGSGKSYLLNRLFERLGSENLCIVSLDNYYRSLEHHPIDAKGIRNFDLPVSIDFNVFSQHVTDLLEGKTVEKEEYTFNNADREPNLIVMESRPVVILEGIYVLYDERVSKHIDCKVFIDVPYPTMIRRRVMRDYAERGYDLEDVLYRYENHVMPAFERYIAPYRNHADIIVPNQGDIEVALDMLTNHLNTQLKARIV